MNVDVIAGLVAQVWPDATAGEPVPLSGGFWADMYRVPVTGQPAGAPSQVVVRFAPHRTMGAKEAEVQRAIAAAGFPTPRVWLSGPDEARDGWWSIMDFVAGVPLLAGLDGAAALRRAPSLLRTLPVQLADAATRLHQLDTAPVTDAVQVAAPEVAWSTGAVLGQLRAGADTVGRTDVVAALDRLAADMPAPGGEVICHGDLHPFNVMTTDERLVVLDWTGALLAHPCFDLAFTELLLANPPLHLPGALAPVGRLAGRLLARRFIAIYARANNTVSLESLGWFRVLHSARVLVEAEHVRATHGPDGGGHPFLAVAPVAARHLFAATGIAVDG